MTMQELQKILRDGESETVEFKSWIHTTNQRERAILATDELVAFANAKGGTLFFGVEDDGVITGCYNYDTQKLIEAIYERTHPHLFSDIEILHHPDGDILAIRVQPDGKIYATSQGKCLKRLGKNSKPFYPSEMSHVYSIHQTPDFSRRIILGSSIDDIDPVFLLSLKEKIQSRSPESTLSELTDSDFLENLEFIRKENEQYVLTIAGLLFVGKESSIRKFLPQAEVIYLHYSSEDSLEYDARMDLTLPIPIVLDRITEYISSKNSISNLQVGLFRLEINDFPLRVIQEAILNALTHRDYQSAGAIYVKQFPDYLQIDNPGSFPEDITPENIITHPSVPRNRLIAETLQRLKYVQRTGQGVDIIYRDTISFGKPYPEYRISDQSVSLIISNTTEDVDFVRFIVNEQERRHKIFSLMELMVLRFLKDYPRALIGKIAKHIQESTEIARKCCKQLRSENLLELSGREYRLSAKSYELLKNTIAYARNPSIQYLKARQMILTFLGKNPFITNEQTRELCGFTRTQARTTLQKMCKEGTIVLTGARRSSKYILFGSDRT